MGLGVNITSGAPFQSSLGAFRDQRDSGVALQQFYEQI